MISQLCTLLLAARITAAMILPQLYTDEETGGKFRLVTRDEPLVSGDLALQIPKMEHPPFDADDKDWYNCTTADQTYPTVKPMYGCNRRHGWADIMPNIQLEDTNFREILHDLLYATMGPWKFDTEAMSRDSLCALLGSNRDDMPGVIRNGIVIGSKLCVSWGAPNYNPRWLPNSNISSNHLDMIASFAWTCAKDGSSSGFHVEDGLKRRIIICISNRANGCDMTVCGRRRQDREEPRLLKWNPYDKYSWDTDQIDTGERWKWELYPESGWVQGS